MLLLTECRHELQKSFEVEPVNRNLDYSSCQNTQCFSDWVKVAIECVYVTFLLRLTSATIDASCLAATGP